MKKKIFEQTTPTSEESFDFNKMRDVYKCPFLQGGSINTVKIVELANNKEEELYNGQVVIRVAANASPTGVYNAGDYLIITNEKEGENWVFYVVPAANWNKQYRRDENKIVLQTSDSEGTWKCDNYTKITSGMAQELTAQMEVELEKLKSKGWRISKGEHKLGDSEWFTWNLNADPTYNKIFKQEFWVIMPKTSISDEKLITAFNELVTKGHSRENCRRMIEIYDSMHDTQSPLNRGDLMKFQFNIQTCRRLNQNTFNDLGITNKRLKKLEQLPDTDVYKLKTLQTSTTTPQ